MAKQRKLSFPTHGSHANSIFHLVHLDIWGPLSTTSIHGHSYFLIVIEDHSRHTWLFLMKHKSETSLHIISFAKMIKTLFNYTIKAIRFDNELEFHLSQFFSSKGMLHQ